MMTLQELYSPLLGLGLFFSFVNFFTQSVGLLGREMSPSQGRYLHTGQHKHRKNAHTDIHALSGIRNHNPSIRASSCLRPHGHCDRQDYTYRPYNRNGLTLKFSRTVGRDQQLRTRFVIKRLTCLGVSRMDRRVILKYL
jgi:hypothetical protein